MSLITEGILSVIILIAVGKGSNIMVSLCLTVTTAILAINSMARWWRAYTPLAATAYFEAGGYTSAKI